MVSLDEFISDNLLSKSNILRFVDDYSIYSFYIGAELELNTKYSSPLRKGDDDPSFSLYYSMYVDKIMFKDQALGLFGDVFDFVAALGGLTLRNALAQINSDFKIGFDGGDTKDFKPVYIKKRPLKKDPVTIRVTFNENPGKDYTDYWDFLEIESRILKDYFVTNPVIIHYIQGESHITFYPKVLTIAYEILGTYKIYHPFEKKKFKFRNNFKSNYIEGALQLKFEKSFAIITKSSKECIFLRQHFDWDTVAGTSENTIIYPYFMLNILKARYKKVFIWLDKDEAGINAQNKYMNLYPWLIPIKVADYIEQKDPTDLFSSAKRAGKKELALKYMRKLIEDKI